MLCCKLPRFADILIFTTLINDHLSSSGPGTDSERSAWADEVGCALVDQTHQRRGQDDYRFCNPTWMGSDGYWELGC